MQTRRLLGLAAVLAGLSSACSHPSPAVVVPSGPAPAERLAAADALVREGCLDCLLDAYREYDALRENAAARSAASVGALESAALIALRERELGMIDEGYLDRANALARADASLAQQFGRALEIVDIVPVRSGLRDAATVARSVAIVTARQERLEELRLHAADNPLRAAAWEWFSCTYSPSRAESELALLSAPTGALKDAPLVVYQALICSDGTEVANLTAFAAAHPRFREVDFWIGSRRVARQDLDGAQAFLTKAYEWHPAWPAALDVLGNLYLTAEEFQTSLDLYERSIALLPGVADPLLGRIRALSYLSRHEEAVRRATELLPIGSASDAYFWRAWNQNQLGAIEDAWADIQSAERLWRNNEVLKLAGIIAYRRHDLAVAKVKFAGAIDIDGQDCEARFDLAGVQIELSEWTDGADEYARTVACEDSARNRLAQEIERLGQSEGPPERVARQVARREAMRAAALRTQVQSWFNGAVANLQLNRLDEARRLAEKIEDDEQFGARAKEILARVK
jgi:tetratricopeptide (TPR) repeat protein